jgi:hypothetical protein
MESPEGPGFLAKTGAGLGGYTKKIDAAKGLVVEP